MLVIPRYGPPAFPCALIRWHHHHQDNRQRAQDVGDQLLLFCRQARAIDVEVDIASKIIRVESDCNRRSSPLNLLSGYSISPTRLICGNEERPYGAAVDETLGVLP